MRFLRFCFKTHPRYSGLCLFITIYVSLFVIAGVILFGSLPTIKSSYKINFEMCKVPQSKIGNVLCANNSAFKYHHQISSSVDKNGINFIANEKHFYLFQKSILHLYQPQEHLNLINCTSLQDITDIEYIAAGWTKIVYRGVFHGQRVAIKTARTDGPDVWECQRKKERTLDMCVQKLDAKIIKEIILLLELEHENIVQMLGFCIPDKDGRVTLVTEVGEQLDTMRLLQISWEDRLRLVLGMARILHYFANSPLGSLSMNDFRREQFVIVDGELKVTDLDDVGLGEPKCINDSECYNINKNQIKSNLSVEENETKSFACINFQCAGHNSRINIWNAGQHLVKLLLPVGAPESLKPYITDLINAYEFKKSSRGAEGTSYILGATQFLVNHYITGEYTRNDKGLEDFGFIRMINSDLPGRFDYRCRFSISAVSCVMSVFDEVEAAQFCSQDLNCKAVVLSSQKTWTGRTIAIFKNGFDSPSVEQGLILLVRESLMKQDARTKKRKLMIPKNMDKDEG